MKLKAKRVYLAADRGDGNRILIDRLWPRGVSKEAAAIDYWAKDVAPSHELRNWYQHDPAKWPTFQARYNEELAGNPEGVRLLRAELGEGMNTIVFSSKEEDLNNATALILYLESLR